MLHLLLPLVLFYIADGLRGTCQNMTNPVCQKAAKKYFNYTVDDISRMRYLHAMITEERVACKLEGECPTAIQSVRGAKVPCSGGSAGQWDCNNIDLHAFVSLSDLGSSNNADGNDIWGYTNSNGDMFAITGQTDGASIVDVTNPSNPEVLCFIPSRISTNTIWRDFKVIGRFAYIVADRNGQGLQWIDLDAAISKCRASSSRPLRLSEGVDFGWSASMFDGTTTQWTNTHNIVANEQQNEVYIVGSSSCSGGLLAVDVSNVNSINDVPQRAGCYSSDGYTHDAECVIYQGPDTTYRGRNICFGYNENSVTIVDMTNPSSPVQLSRLTYSGSRYTHQGWITDDHEWLLMNDELDEQGGTVSSQTTYVIDLRNGLANPSLTRWASGLNTIDHNLYIRGNYVYEANYKSGLRILNLENIDSPIAQNKLSETGYFKTYLPNMNMQFDGAWSVYPFFQKDDVQPTIVVVQDINTGLYILDPTNAVS